MTDPYYQDDHVTLWHGDCLELADVWTGADVLVTDPPYGVAYQSGWPASFPRSVANDATPAVRDAALSIWIGPALVFGSWRVAKPGGISQTLIWDKGDDPGMGDLSLPWGSFWEEIYVIGGGFIGVRRNGILRGWRCPKSNRDHPTPKPIGLMEHLLSRCPPGTIADPFAGSGSTLVAAKALGRKAIGVELEERYCEIAARRLAQDVLDFGDPA